MLHGLTRKPSLSKEEISIVSSIFFLLSISHLFARNYKSYNSHMYPVKISGTCLTLNVHALIDVKMYIFLYNDRGQVMNPFRRPRVDRLTFSPYIDVPTARFLKTSQVPHHCDVLLTSQGNRGSDVTKSRRYEPQTMDVGEMWRTIIELLLI